MSICVKPTLDGVLEIEKIRSCKYFVTCGQEFIGSVTKAEAAAKFEEVLAMPEPDEMLVQRWTRIVNRINEIESGLENLLESSGTSIWPIIILILVGVSIFYFFSSNSIIAERFNCSSFKTQEQAQRYFDKNNDRRLDRDDDKQACEHLP